MAGYKRSVVANALGLSEKRVKQLTEEGILEEVAPGYYGLKESIQSYIRYLQNKNGDDGSTDVGKEKYLMTKAKREKIEAEVALIKGELHKASDIENAMGKILVAFKAKMLGLPHKVLPQIIATQDKNEIVEILRTAVYDALEELATYDELFDEELGEDEDG